MKKLTIAACLLGFGVASASLLASGRSMPPASGDGPGSSLDEPDDELASLRAELRSLKSSVRLLKANQNEQQQALLDQPAAPRTHHEEEPAPPRWTEEEERDMTGRFYEDAFAEQALDPTAGAESADAIASKLTTFEGITVNSVECGEKLCRVEVNSADFVAKDRFVLALGDEPFGNGAYWQVQEDDSLLAYALRPGEALPKMPFPD